MDCRILPAVSQVAFKGEQADQPTFVNQAESLRRTIVMLMDLRQAVGEVVLLMNDLYPDRVMEKYGIDDLTKPEEVFKAAAVKNGILLKGGEPDMQRAADLILTDLRSGKLGRITLEEPSL